MHTNLIVRVAILILILVVVFFAFQPRVWMERVQNILRGSPTPAAFKDNPSGDSRSLDVVGALLLQDPALITTTTQKAMDSTNDIVSGYARGMAAYALLLSGEIEKQKGAIKILHDEYVATEESLVGTRSRILRQLAAFLMTTRSLELHDYLRTLPSFTPFVQENPLTTVGTIARSSYQLRPNITALLYTNVDILAQMRDPKTGDGDKKKIAQDLITTLGYAENTYRSEIKMAPSPESRRISQEIYLRMRALYTSAIARALPEYQAQSIDRYKEYDDVVNAFVQDRKDGNVFIQRRVAVHLDHALLLSTFGGEYNKQDAKKILDQVARDIVTYPDLFKLSKAVIVGSFENKTFLSVGVSAEYETLFKISPLFKDAILK
jgi:hypothetical protein